MKTEHGEDEASLIVEVILSLHQEKRTALKAIRVGITMVAAQASLLGMMITTSAYHTYIQARHWTMPFTAFNMLFSVMALGLIVEPLVRIHRLNRKIMEFEKK